MTTHLAFSKRLVLLCLALGLLVSPNLTAGEVEATSLLGRDLIRPELPAAVVERHERSIETLRQRLADNPDDADALVWIGRHLGYLGRYQQAIDVFSEGVEQTPSASELGSSYKVAD